MEETSTEPAKIPDRWYWMKGSDGNASVTTTFVTVAFWVTTLSYVASMFESAFGVSFRAFDPAACAAYFTPLAALYFGRRFTEAKYKSDNV